MGDDRDDAELVRECLGGRRAAFEALLARHEAAVYRGVYRILHDSEDAREVVQEYVTKPIEQGVWESHRNYIDVQHIVSGTERMGIANLGTMPLGEYVPDKDFQALSGTGNFLDVFAGSFVIFFPDDAHMPGLQMHQPELIRKGVLKVGIQTRKAT